MKLEGNAIPKDLYDAENKLKGTLDATDAFLEEHAAVFEQFQELVNRRNEQIDECAKICKKRKCSTELFKTNEARKISYDPESFREVFGPKKLIQTCELPSKKVKAMLESGLIKKEDLDRVERDEKVSVRVTGRYKKWDIS